MAVPVVIGGSRGTEGTQGILSELIIRDVDDMLHLLEPSATPLTLLLNMAGKESAHATKKEWNERERTPTEDTISGSHTDSITTITVVNPNYVPVNSLIRVQSTGETMRVTAVPGAGSSPGDLTVSARPWAGSNTALSGGESYTIFGGAAAENAPTEEPRSVKAVAQFNETEIKRDIFGVSDTLKNSDLYGGDDLVNLRKERGIEHQVYLEKVAFFGQRAEDVAGAYRIGSAGGLEEFITTNSFDFAGTVTLTKLFNWAETAFRYGDKKVKLLFMPRGVASNVNLIAESALRKMDVAKTFGISMQRLVTPHGEWNMMTHNLLEGDTWGLQAFSVQLENFRYVFFQNRDTKLRQNIEARGVDGTEEEYLTEFTYKRVQERTFGVGDNMDT